MKKFFLSALICGCLFACKKDESQNEIPYVPVDIVISLAQYTTLNSVTGWAYIPGGSKGIAVYRYSQDEFYAMDRHCPYQPANGNQLSVDSTNIFLADGACGSKFNMVYGGTVSNGPATRPLKRYNISYDGITTLHIYN